MENQESAGASNPTDNQQKPDAEALRGALTEINSRPEKRGRGRPPKNPAVGAGNSPSPSKPDSGNNKNVVLTPEDERLIAGLAEMSFNLLDSFACAKIRKSAAMIAGAEKAEQLVKETRLTPEEMGNIKISVVAIARKYNMSARFTPEISLGIVLVSYGGRVASTIKELNLILASAKRVDATKPQEP